jgi:hypothetical protein
MGVPSTWSWQTSLALAEHGDVVQVKDVLFGMIRDHLEDLGIRRGSVLECLQNGSGSILVSLPDGERAKVERQYAWFVSVERMGL